MDLTATLKNYDGSPIMDKPGEAAAPITMGAAILQALITPLTGDEKMEASGKLEIALLTRDIHSNLDGDMGFTSEQITMIKDRVARAYAPSVMLAIWETIDPPSVAV